MFDHGHVLRPVAAAEPRKIVVALTGAYCNPGRLLPPPPAGPGLQRTFEASGTSSDRASQLAGNDLATVGVRGCHSV